MLYPAYQKFTAQTACEIYICNECLVASTWIFEFVQNFNHIIELRYNANGISRYLAWYITFLQLLLVL